MHKRNNRNSKPSPLHPNTERLKTGRRAENLALWYLRLKGYHLVDRNVVTGRGTGAGEVDLIMKKRKTLVFIEVKHRKTLTQALEAVTIRNQIRVARASSVFLQKNPQYQNYDIRYDAFLCAPGRWPKHLQNAWRIL